MDHQRLASALASLPSIKKKLAQRVAVFFLDFDGTLAPIVVQPESAQVPKETRQSLGLLAKAYPVCIVSGRSLDFLIAKIGLSTVYYAADHGHRIVGPRDSGVDFELGPDDVDELQDAARKLQAALGETRGALLEIKEISVAVHYRRVARQDHHLVTEAVHEVLQESPGLRLMEGKMVYELLPDLAWGKGKAVLWLLDHLQHSVGEVFPICLGDDLTDEEMFAAIKGHGVAIVVGDVQRPTHADYRLDDTSEVSGFVRAFAFPPGGSGLDVV